MLLVLQFDIDADIIDVPKEIIDTKDLQKKRFLKWLYSNKSHKYWAKGIDMNGNTFMGLRYRADAFVEWLNGKVLKGNDNASILETSINDYPRNIPVIYF